MRMNQIRFQLMDQAGQLNQCAAVLAWRRTLHQRGQEMNPNAQLARLSYQESVFADCQVQSELFVECA